MKTAKAKIRAIVHLNRIFFKKAKWLFLYNVCNSVIVGPCISVVGVVMVQLVMEALLSYRPTQYVVLLTVSLTGIQIIGNLIQLGIAYFLTEKINLRIKASITKDFLDRVKHIDYCYLDDPKYQDNLQYVGNNLANQVSAAHALLSTLLLNISTIIAVVFIIFSLSSHAIIVFSIVSAIITTIIRGRITKIGFQKNQEFIPAERRCRYYETVYKERNFAEDLRCTQLSNIITAEYNKNIDVQEETIKKYSFKLAIPVMGNISFSSALTCLCLIYIGISISKNIVSQASILPTLLESYNKLSVNLNSIFKCDAQLTELSLFYEKYQDLMQLKCEIENYEERQYPCTISSEPFDIQFNDVYFSYPNSHFVLNGLNLQIKKGETIAFVGINGAGKTTLIKLLLRLYDVSDGTIYINGEDIKDYNPYLLRRRIGYTPQAPNLYSCSIGQNLSLYGDTSDDEIKNIVKKMGLANFLNKFNADIDSQVSRKFDPNGIMLSGGEAQKLAIARTIGNEFGLLIFDEPTAALDPMAEKEIMDQIYQRASCTTAIIIAHRLSTVKNADRIYVLESGEIIEYGSHEELLKLGGKYKEMYYVQGENYQLTI